MYNIVLMSNRHRNISRLELESTLIWYIDVHRLDVESTSKYFLNRACVDIVLVVLLQRNYRTLRQRCQNRCQMVAATQFRKRIFSTVAATLPNDCDRKFSNSKTLSRATFPQRFPGNGLATFPGQLFGNHLATMVA